MTVSRMDAAIASPEPSRAWRLHMWQWLMLLSALAILSFIAFDGLAAMIRTWSGEEYSHGYMLPLVFLFLAWQRSSILTRTPHEPSWSGAVIVLCGLLLLIGGGFGTVVTIVQYGFLVTLAGLLLAFLGWKAFRISAAAAPVVVLHGAAAQLSL